MGDRETPKVALETAMGGGSTRFDHAARALHRPGFTREGVPLPNAPKRVAEGNTARRRRGSSLDLVLAFLDEPFSTPGGIGLFDSGVGGLTVLAPLVAHEPRWPTVMVADQAHVPYGGRPLDEIRELALSQTAFLFSTGVEVVVMACNISSATALEEARRRHGPDRVFGMVEPGCVAASARTRSKRIAILATEGTVRAGAYERGLRALDPDVHTRAIACPEFVPLIEAGHVDDAEARRAVAPRLQAVRDDGADVVVLGCTHYPHLAGTLRREAPDLVFVDPAEGILDAIRHRVTPARETTPPRILTTASRVLIADQVRRLGHGLPEPRIGRAIWRIDQPSVDEDPSRALG